MRSRKEIRPLIVLTVAGVLGIAVFLSANPLRQSEETIKASLLAKAPLGSSPKEVETLIISQGWKKVYEFQGAPSSHSETVYPYVKGEHIISALLGQYRGVPWKVYVDAFWGFDSNGKLVDLRVRKGVDAL